MNKKGQAGNVMSVLLIVVLTGILLAVFQPTLNDFRLQNIENIDNYPDQYSALMKLFMYGLLPIMWIFYIFLSILIVFVTVNQNG